MSKLLFRRRGWPSGFHQLLGDDGKIRTYWCNMVLETDKQMDVGDDMVYFEAADTSPGGNSSFFPVKRFGEVYINMGGGYKYV